MKMYEIELESISPMLHHSAQFLGMEEDKVMKKKGGNALLGDSEEWRKTIYFDKDFGVYLPAIVVEACIIEGAKQFKITGKTTATKFFKSGVFITEEMLTFSALDKNNKFGIIKSLDDVEVDKRTVKNPATKGRNVRYRALFRQWKSKFRIVVNSDDYIDKKLLSSVFEYAGNYVGLCDFRPRFGRFKVNKIIEVN